MRPASLVSLFLLCSCAGMDQSGCQHADWYDLGFRDAIFGLQRQDDQYVHQCEAHGVKIDVSRYQQGWREGKYEADQRNGGSMD